MKLGYTVKALKILIKQILNLPLCLELKVIILYFFDSTRTESRPEAYKACTLLLSYIPALKCYGLMYNDKYPH